MTQDHDDTDGLPDLTNRQVMKIVMQEIADVYVDLKRDISGVKKDVADLDTKLSGGIESVASDVHTLRLEVHQNQTTFMTNHAELEHRVEVLEAAA